MRPRLLERLIAVAPGLLCTLSVRAIMYVSTARPQSCYISCTLCCEIIGWFPGSKFPQSVSFASTILALIQRVAVLLSLSFRLSLSRPLFFLRSLKLIARNDSINLAVYLSGFISTI